MLKILSPLVLVLGTLCICGGGPIRKQLAKDPVMSCVMSAGDDSAVADPVIKTEIVQGTKGLFGSTLTQWFPEEKSKGFDRAIKYMEVRDHYCDYRNKNEGPFATIKNYGIGQTKALIEFQFKSRKNYKYTVTFYGK